MKPLTDLTVEIVDIETIRPHPDNPRTNHQIGRIVASIEAFGWRQPIVVDPAGFIIAGHGRYYAAREMRLTQVPVHVARDLTPDEIVAYRIADNRSSESEWDLELLIPQIDYLSKVPDLTFKVEAIGYDRAEIEALLHPSPAGGDGVKLSDRFMIPPFSVLDTRSGWWLGRKRAWVALGIRSELGRGDDARIYGQGLMRNAFYRKKQKAEKRMGRSLTTAEFLSDHYADDEAGGAGISASGTSIFDPVLCEIVYRWFSPPRGRVLDPFAGGSVRGVVAGILGREYDGVDLRDGQVRANIEQWPAVSQVAGIPDTQAAPRWITGDSADVIPRIAETYDLIFTCPPYYDLESYSKDPADLSAMSPADFDATYRRIIAAAAARLEDDRFAAFVVSNVRDAAGNYRDLVGLTVAACESAGLHYYNEAILVNPVGSLPIRVSRQFVQSRKMGRTHQLLLIFIKGDAVRATSHLGDVDLSVIEAIEDHVEKESPAAGPGDDGLDDDDVDRPDQEGTG